MPAEYAGRFVSLHFDGIDQRANIWVNGEQIANAKEVDGAFRTYEFDVTRRLSAGAENALAVEAIAQTPQDLGINWIDWNPTPPDKNMGLRREVYLEGTGPVAILHPFVATHFPSAALDEAELTIETELRNNAAQRVSGVLTVEFGALKFERDVSLDARELRTVRFTPAQYSELRLQQPKLWWPRQMGEPALQSLRLEYKTAAGEVSDKQSVFFGIREITSSLDENGHRLFRINGKRLLIRGAGWAPDMLWRESPERLRAEFRYVRDLNLNTIRLEGKFESQSFYKLADEQGVLVLAGWACCDRWQDGDKWSPRDLQIASESLRSQVFALRGHPSTLAWMNGSDKGPPVNVERAYLKVLNETDWPNPILFSASERPSVISGTTGMKMTGPYDYVPADFWLADAEGRNGGAVGFNTETGPGAGIPPEGSLRRMFAAEHLRTDDPEWDSHNALGRYSKLDHFEETMRASYGAPLNLPDYERKAQAMAYDSERAMFEAYSRNKYSSTTGIVQWMLNNAWPSLYWHLYDYYLQPAGGYFGAKKGLEPVHVQYSYDDRTVVAVNSTYLPAPGLKINTKIYDSGLHEIFSRDATVDLAPDSIARVLTIPADTLSTSSPIHYVRLNLTGRGGQEMSHNFYWLASRRNVFDWRKATYRFTPVQSYEDLTALAALETVPLSASAQEQPTPGGPRVTVKVQNRSKTLAFQVHLGIRRKGEDSEVLPVTWTDNYFELLPGESREATAEFLSVLQGSPELVVSGWNVEPFSVNIQAKN